MRQAAAGVRLGPRGLAAVQFAISACALLLVVGTAGVFALRHVARDEALHDATRLTRTLTDAVIAPHVDKTLLTGDEAARARLDAALTPDAIGSEVVRVKLWTPDGRLVWSDEHRYIGLPLQPSERVAQVAHDGRGLAEVSDLVDEENSFERGDGPLVEVYVPVTAADGTRLVAETYLPTSAVTAASQAIWRSFLPVLIVALIALALAQLPLAWWWGRKTREEAAHRLELLARAELARQDERSRIAADLHDGVVQDLAGAAFDLAANANQVQQRSRDQLASALANGAEVARSAIAQLRAMLVQLHPGEPVTIDLARALPDLAADLKARGVRVDVRVAPVDLDADHTALLYRAAQEGVRNVARHAAATRATISLSESDGVATLLVEDDGQGMTSRDLVQQRAAGHVGLTLLADRVRAQRGELTISSEPGRGTRLVVWLPLAARGRRTSPAASSGGQEDADAAPEARPRVARKGDAALRV